MNPPSAASRRRWPVIGLALLGGVVIAGGCFILRERHRREVQSALAPAPAGATNPRLHDLLANARERALTGDLVAIGALGRLYHANGFPTEAAACWRLLTREQPREGRWPYYLADLLRTAGDQPAAEQTLEQTVARDPTAASAWLQLAEMRLKTGRAGAAETAYRRRLELIPGDPYASLGLARIAELRGQRAETFARLEPLIQAHPGFSAAHNFYAELQAAAGNEELADLHRWRGREAGRFREAEDPWLNELNAACHEPRRLSHLGTIAYQTGRGDLGRAQFEEAIQLEPGDPLPYQLLGELLLEKGEAPRAYDVLMRGIERATVTAPAPAHFVQLSAAALALQRPAEARAALVTGLARHPDAAELQLAWGNWLTREDRFEDAATALRRAVVLNPGLVEADFALATLLLQHGRKDEAVAALQHARAMQPTFPKAMILLARLEIDAGRLNEAGQYLLPVLKANPGVPEIRRIVASWRQQCGERSEKSDPADAERHYRAGLKLLPEDPALNSRLGVLLLLAGRVEEAVSPLEMAQRTQPGNAQAAFFLGQAYARLGRLDDARRLLTAGLQQAEQSGQTATARNLREILSLLPPP